MIEASAIVLAGGQSRRLGRDKTQLRINGKTLLARAVERLAALCPEVIIATNSPDRHAHPLARCVTDVFPGKGVLGGIYSGLAAATLPRAIVVAVDMPFLNDDLLAYLVSLAPGYDVVAPVIEHHVEPLHAVYGVTCLPAMRESLLAAPAPRIISFYPDVHVRQVTREEVARFDPELLSLFNINSLDDIERARAILQQRGLDFDA